MMSSNHTINRESRRTDVQTERSFSDAFEREHNIELTEILWTMGTPILVKVKNSLSISIETLPLMATDINSQVNDTWDSIQFCETDNRVSMFSCPAADCASYHILPRLVSQLTFDQDNSRGIRDPCMCKHTLIDKETLGKLLSLIRTDKFAGTIDMKYHARYLVPPHAGRSWIKSRLRRCKPRRRSNACGYKKMCLDIMEHPHITEISIPGVAIGVEDNCALGNLKR
jgi:hypothetical protein